LLPTIVYLVMSPTDLISNTIIYAVRRPIDSTSWMYGLQPSSEYRLLALVALAAILLIVCLHLWFNDVSLLQRCAMSVACIVIAMLGGPVVHRNYLLWWLPFFALLVAIGSSRYCNFGLHYDGEAKDSGELIEPSL
jgi:hypothetical protein